jgi:trans-aconitate 2-methyltransferase
MDLLEWDATTYDSLPLPHVRWGAGVIERLGLRGNETVVDLGCGTGRDTEVLLDRLPDVRVIAVDGSVQMLDRLRDRLGKNLGRVEVVQADLTQPFPDVVAGNAVMSVATFHWVPDHAALFRRVARALPPNGRFEAEFGGEGNIAGFLRAVERAGGPKDESPWEFANRLETVEQLITAGFKDIEVRVVPDPAVLERGPQLEAFIATVLLGAVLREMDADEGRALVKRTAAQMPEPVVDYVRMQVSATRA